MISGYVIFLKDRVHQGRVIKKADLKCSIARHVCLIPTDILRVVVDIAMIRFQYIVDC